MKFRQFTWIVFYFLGIILFILHGLGENRVHFKVDLVSIFLLIFAAFPLLGEYLEKFKVGSVEAQFRTLSFAGQITTFLHVLATDRKLTFYKPRQRMGEFKLGTAGSYLIERMFFENRKRTIRSIKKWLNEEEENLRWFASEIIGYFGLKELAAELFMQYKKLDPDSDWTDWHMNCLWAHSKITNKYKEMNKFLIETNSESNQDWVLDVYPQMCDAGELKPLEVISSNLMDNFLKRPDLTPAIRKKTVNILKELDQLSKKTPIKQLHNGISIMDNSETVPGHFTV